MKSAPTRTGWVPQVERVLSADACAFYDEAYGGGGAPWMHADPDGPLLAAVGAGRGRRALDLGAGGGRNARALAALGWAVVAVDAWRGHGDGRTGRDERRNRVRWVWADALRWLASVPTGSVDLVVDILGPLSDLADVHAGRYAASARRVLSLQGRWFVRCVPARAAIALEAAPWGRSPFPSPRGVSASAVTSMCLCPLD